MARMTTTRRKGAGWLLGISRSMVTVAAAGTLSTAAAQERIEIPAQDRLLDADLLDQVFVVGAADGRDWELFGEIADVAFDGAGLLYVFDRQAKVITVADRDGRFVRTVGTPGEGPGELRMPMGFTVLRDGTVVVADLGHRAFVLYGPDGSWKRSVSMGDGGMILLGQLRPGAGPDQVVSGGGNRIMMAMTRGGPPAAGPPAGRPIDVLDLSGATVSSRTLVRAWEAPKPDEPAVLQGGGMRFSVATSGPAAFEPGLYVSALPSGGVAYVDSSTYALKVTDAAGRLQRVVTRPLRPRPVTDAIREAERERRLADLESGEGQRMTLRTTGGAGGGGTVPQSTVNEMMRNSIADMEFYHELPVIRAMVGGWNGKMWVQRRGQAPSDAGPTDVLTPEGRYVGTFAADRLELPDAFGPDGLVAFIERDAFDVPSVRVRRLPAILR